METQTITGVEGRYGPVADAYDRLWAPVLRERSRELIAALPLRRARRVADLGTGTGGLLPDLRAATRRGRVIGVDRTAPMAGIARRHAPIAVGDLQQLPLRSASVDVAVCAFVLFHLEDPGAALAEAARVLQPGGSLGVAVWSVRGVSRAEQLWERVLDQHGAPPPPPPLERSDHLLDTPETLAGLLEATGFVGVRTWHAPLGHRWQPDLLLRLLREYGSNRLRYDWLPERTRSAIDAAAAAVFPTLAPDDLVDPSEVLFAVATRS